MSKITTDLIKELREKTQIGMMDCKKALIEADGDLEKATELLRKKGAAVAAKRADNETNNGNIESCISSDYKSGAIIKISCETDFSANTQDMKNFAKEVCESILENKNKKEDSILNQKCNDSVNVQDKLNDLIARIAEKIEVWEFDRFEVEKEGLVSSYIHPGSNLGVLIELSTDKEIDAQNLDKVKGLSKDICMQIAVTNPLCVIPAQLETKTIEKELTLIKEQLKESGKPEAIIDKIAEGKMRKYYEEVCLLNQKFIKNDKLTIKNHVDQVAKETGLKIEVKKYTRLKIGK